MSTRHVVHFLPDLPINLPRAVLVDPDASVHLAAPADCEADVAAQYALAHYYVSLITPDKIGELLHVLRTHAHAASAPVECAMPGQRPPRAGCHYPHLRLRR